MSLQQTHQNFMVYTVKESADIQLDGKTGIGIIFTNLSGDIFQFGKCFVSSFVISARITVIDKDFVKGGIKHSVNCVMQEAVTNGRFTNYSGFGVGNPKLLITPMLIDASR